jgi:hypothetical protein
MLFELGLLEEEIWLTNNWKVFWKSLEETSVTLGSTHSVLGPGFRQNRKKLCGTSYSCWVRLGQSLKLSAGHILKGQTMNNKEFLDLLEKAEAAGD